MNTSSNIAEQGKKKKPFDVIGFALRRAPVIAAIGGAMFILLLPFVFFLGKNNYQATGFLLIARVIQPTMMMNEPAAITGYFGDYARTQALRVTSYEVLYQALSTLPKEKWPHFLPQDVSLNASTLILKKKLISEFIPRTHFIKVELEASSPHGLADIVNQVMKIFLEKVRSEQERRHQNRISYLLDAKADLEKQLEAKQDAITEIMLKSQTSNFSETFNIRFTEMKLLEEAFVKARVERMLAEKQLQSSEKEKEAISKLSLQALADELVASDQSLWEIGSWTYKTLQQLRASIDGIAKDNPDRKYVEERMAGMENYLKTYRKSIEDRAARIVTDKRDYELKKNVILSQLAHESTSQTEKDIREAIQEASKMSSETSLEIQKGQKLQVAIENLLERMVPLEKRIQEAIAESKNPIRLSIEADAREPKIPADGLQKKLLMMIFVFSFGSIGGVLVVFDFLDNRIRGIKEVAASLGTAPPPAVPFYQPAEGGTDFSRLVLNQPTHAAAGSLQSLGIRLEKECRTHQAKVILFGGTEAEAGVTSLLLNTAQVMSRFFQNILVVEGNLQHPSFSQFISSAQPAHCLEDVVETQKVQEGTIVKDPERGLYLIFARGQIGQKNFLTSLRSLLDSARKSYDLVLLDIGVIPGSNTAEFILPETDIAVVVTREDQSLYNNLRTTIEMIARAEVPAMTVLLNRSRPKTIAYLNILLQGKLGELSTWKGMLTAKWVQKCKQKLVNSKVQQKILAKLVFKSRFQELRKGKATKRSANAAATTSSNQQS